MIFLNDIITCIEPVDDISNSGIPNLVPTYSSVKSKFSTITVSYVHSCTYFVSSRSTCFMHIRIYYSCSTRYTSRLISTKFSTISTAVDLDILSIIISRSSTVSGYSCFEAVVQCMDVGECAHAMPALLTPHLVCTCTLRYLYLGTYAY
jgi:hypothetical protein